MEAFFHTRKLVFVLGFLPTVFRIALAQECEPHNVRQCYDRYRDYLLRPREIPALVSEGDLKQCSGITEKTYCHQKIALCPEEVRRNFSLPEKGYEALRDLLCDQKAARDYYTALRCQNDLKAITYHEKHRESSPHDYMQDPSCGLAKAAMTCYESSFTSDCDLPLKSAKSVFFRGEHALLLLADCSGSAKARLAPGQLLLAATAVILFRWSSALW